MSLIEFSENELNRLLQNCTDSESLHAQKMINDDIMEMVKTFSQQGHSGFSASYSLNILKRLLDYKPLSALTDDDNDWVQLDYGDDIAYQNKRCPSVFKDINGKVYNTEGKVFSDDNGHTWFTSADSRVYVELPYTVPDKPEYVIIDNQKERLAIMYHIINRINYLGAHIVNTDITEDVELISILDKDKFKDLENILIEDYNITKPLFTIDEDDTKIWNVINFVMKSEKEEPEKEDVSIENESVDPEIAETTEVSDELLNLDEAE